MENGINRKIQYSKSRIPFSLIISISLKASFVLALTYAAFLRFYKLGHQSYWMDEGFTVNAVQSILKRGTSALASGAHYNCSTYCFPTSIATRFFGPDNPFSYRFLAALAGSVFLLVIYIIARELFENLKTNHLFSWGRIHISQRTAIAGTSSLFSAFSYWQIAWSRQARWYSLLELFFWLSIYFFWRYRSLKSNKAPDAILTIFFTVLTILTGAQGFSLVIIFLLWLLIENLVDKSDLKSWLRTLSFIGGLLAMSFLADYVFGNIILFRALTNLRIYYTLPYYLNFYLHNYWLIIALILLGLTITGKHFKKDFRIIKFLALILLINILMCGLFSNAVNYRYLFHITPGLFLISSYGIIRLADRIKIQSGRAAFLLVVFFAFFAAGEGTAFLHKNYFLESDSVVRMSTRPYYSFTPQPDYKAAYNYVKERMGTGQIVISSQAVFNKIYLDQPGYWLQYKYLGSSDPASYVQANGKEIYAGAGTIASMNDLQITMKDKHGFIIVDSFSLSDRIPAEIIQNIRSLELVYSSEANIFSGIWVYKF